MAPREGVAEGCKSFKLASAMRRRERQSRLAIGSGAMVAPSIDVSRRKVFGETSSQTKDSTPRLLLSSFSFFLAPSFSDQGRV